MERTRIESISIYAADFPLHRDFSISGSSAGFASNVLVALHTRDGRTGWGEASPVSRVTGETQATCIAKARRIKAALIGRDAADIPACVSILDAVAPAAPTIRSAFDMALHDLAAQRAGLPLWKFLGGDAAPKLPTDATIFLRPLEHVAARARQLKSDGFRALKIKLGDPSRDDVERIRLVRETVGPHIQLRADANEAWSRAFAAHTLKAIARFDVVFCEQPLPAHDRAGLQALARNSPVPLMADESLFSPADAARLARRGPFTFFNIKLSKSGGLFHAQAIARRAAAANIPCMIGCMNESRLGLTASAHFAAANTAVKFYDLDSFLMQTEDWTAGGGVLKDGHAILPRVPGLGARPHAAWLKKKKPVA